VREAVRVSVRESARRLSLGALGARKVGFLPIDSSDPFVVMEVGCQLHCPSKVGRAEVIIDWEIDEVAAWGYQVSSRGRKNAFFGRGGLQLDVTEGTTELPEKVKMVIGSDFVRSKDTNPKKSSFSFFKSLKRSTKMSDSYEFNSRLTWKVTESSGDGNKKKIVVISEPVAEESVLQGNAKSCSKASIWSWTQYEELESKGGVSQTRASLYVTCCNYEDASVLQRDDHLKQHLSSLCDMRKFFDRSKELDYWNRSNLVEIVKRKEEIYTDAENDVVNKGKQLRSDFFSLVSTVEVKSNSPLVSIRLNVDSNRFGRATTRVRASKLEVSCGCVMYLSRERGANEKCAGSAWIE